MRQILVAMAGNPRETEGVKREGGDGRGLKDGHRLPPPAFRLTAFTRIAPSPPSCTPVICSRIEPGSFFSLPALRLTFHELRLANDERIFDSGLSGFGLGREKIQGPEF